MKWIIYALLAWLAWRLLRRWQDTPSAPVAKEPERMVRCLVCGVNVPLSEAIADANGHYCSPAHQQAAQRDRPTP